jgi:hypothetical protein
MASIEQIQTLIIENNTLVEKMITKLHNDLLRKIADLSNPDLIVPITRRTRTITPVSEDDRCTQTLVSGKNKGGKCSKKATVGSLCTMHNKKVIQEVVEPEVVEPEVVEPEVVEMNNSDSEEPEVVEMNNSDSEEPGQDFMIHLQE